MDTVTLDQCRMWLEHLRSATIAVIGDLMLDHYYMGVVHRISPEAPVPVVELTEETFRLGGTANVAHNLRLLGADVLLCGCVGNDSAGTQLIELARQLGIITDGIIVDSQRPTTVKTRIIGNNQQLLRLDHERRTPISTDVINAILDRLGNAGQLSALVLEDYNKGALPEPLINATIEWARRRSIPVFVDPKIENFFAYRGATLVKPNQKETQYAVGFPLESDQDVVRAGRQLIDQLDTDHVLVTLGGRGMVLLERAGTYWHIPSVARHVADVSGAGDTVIATLAAMVAAGASVRQAAVLANLAAGVVCGEPGVVPINARALLQAVASWNAVDSLPTVSTVVAR